MKAYTFRPSDGAAQKAWDYASITFGEIKSLAFIVGCRQKGFWHCIMKEGKDHTFLHSVAMDWYYNK